MKSPFFVRKSFKFIIFIHFSWANPNLFWPNLIFSLCLLVKSQFWLLNNFAEMEMMNYWDDGYGQISTTEVQLVLWEIWDHGDITKPHNQQYEKCEELVHRCDGQEVEFWWPNMRIPNKGGLTIPHFTCFDHGTHWSLKIRELTTKSGFSRKKMIIGMVIWRRSNNRMLLYFHPRIWQLKLQTADPSS